MLRVWGLYYRAWASTLYRFGLINLGGFRVWSDMLHLEHAAANIVRPSLQHAVVPAEAQNIFKVVVLHNTTLNP